MYRDKKFRVRKLDELQAEIDWVRGQGIVPRKVFLADGDALMAKASFLAELLDRLREAWPQLRRVSCYASPQSLQVRKVEEMAMLKDKGLTLYYLGVESGHDRVLSNLDKGVDSVEMIDAANKAHQAGVKLSTMILLGAGNRALSREHALESARVVNAIQPRFVSTLVMTPVDGTPLAEADARGEVDELDPVELAAELREFIGALDLRGTVFRSNHASNWLALAGTLPKDQAGLLAALDSVLDDPKNAPFRPAWRRAL